MQKSMPISSCFFFILLYCFVSSSSASSIFFACKRLCLSLPASSLPRGAAPLRALRHALRAIHALLTALASSPLSSAAFLQNPHRSRKKDLAEIASHSGLEPQDVRVWFRDMRKARGIPTNKEAGKGVCGEEHAHKWGAGGGVVMCVHAWSWRSRVCLAFFLSVRECTAFYLSASVSAREPVVAYVLDRSRSHCALGQNHSPRASEEAAGTRIGACLPRAGQSPRNGVKG